MVQKSRQRLIHGNVLRLLGTALLVVATFLVPAASRSVHAGTLVGPRAYYLVLGDSLAYGYQPDGDFTHGYSVGVEAALAAHGPRNSVVNLACIDETASSFINGGCPYWYLRKTLYFSSQLQAALSFIHSHRNQVSPVTIDIGANDVLPLLNSSTCAAPSPGTVSATFSAFDANYTSILRQLKTALAGSGDLLTMNYYFPYQNSCPALVPLAQQFNAHLVADAASQSVPVADVFSAFGGAATPNLHICTWTWICSSYHDIHATTAGYQVIGAAINALEGY